jgi:hypothetical protein
MLTNVVSSPRGVTASLDVLVVVLIYISGELVSQHSIAKSQASSGFSQSIVRV